MLWKQTVPHLKSADFWGVLESVLLEEKSLKNFDSLQIRKYHSCQLFLEELVMTTGEQYNNESIVVYSCIKSRS